MAVVLRTLPPTCPWRCLDHPLVRDVIAVHRAREHGLHEALVGGWARCPRRVVEGLVEYDAAMASALAAARQRRRKQRDSG